MERLYKLSLLVLLIVSVLSCSSSKMKLEKEAPLVLNEVYFQKWTSGIENGGQGINIYFPSLINQNNTTLDSVFFRKMKGKIRTGKASYFANLRPTQPNDIIMHGDSKQEYGNTANTFPFNLKDNECVISYIDNGSTKYFKVDGIIEKQPEYYPSAPTK